VESYWPLYSNPGRHSFVSADPTQRSAPDRFYLPAVKVDGDLGFAHLISNTSYYHRKEETGYDGTLYNLGFYQSEVFTSASFLPGLYPLIDGNGIHLPPGATNYRSPASVDNAQENFAEEVRLQSADTGGPLTWTTGLFFGLNKQSYLEQIHDPLLQELSVAATGLTYDNFFVDPNGNPVLYDARFPNDSYFLQTHSEDKQIAWFGEGTYSFTDQWKATVGARYSLTKFSFNTLTCGPQLYLAPQTGSGDKKENSFTPKFSLSYQADPRNLYYFTYAKGFRPGGANNPVPAAACADDFTSFGIASAPQTFKSDTVNSFEVGAKNNIDNRFKIASSIYYIRWNNIQQTVVPPICQISFITNLGTAVAKGVDIQGDIALTDSFTAELSAGYTEGRYTKDSRLTPVETSPIVASGDAIVGQSGQPAPPVTVSLGLAYTFTVAEHDAFLRVDDEYQGRPKWAGAVQDANTLQYDAANYTLASTNFASARAGLKFGDLQVEAFCDNLADTHTVTNYNFTIDPGDGTSRLQRQFTFRPRTFGLTFIFRSK
jgi:outer membrane receptor protein involved in Fe transport